MFRIASAYSLHHFTEGNKIVLPQIEAEQFCSNCKNIPIMVSWDLAIEKRQI